MCSRAAWKELEALSNQEGSSHCYPFNYVVWVSTVVISKAGWGHALGGLCLCLCVWRMCVWLCVSCVSKSVCVWVQGFSVCLHVWFLFAWVSNYKCVACLKCVYSLFVVHQRVSPVGVIDSLSRSEPSETCLCIWSQRQESLSGFVCFYLDLTSLSPFSLPLRLFLSLFILLPSTPC